jgi:riboflavin kinase/FMN adenylyltransferase
VTFIRDLAALPPAFQAGALTIGNFDGVHRGHAALAEQLLETARAADGPAVVFTFEPHPAQVLRPEIAPVPLVWPERKVELLEGLGIDLVVAFPTDQQFLSLPAKDFFDKVVCEHLNAQAVIEGDNFCFGNNREGTIEMLGSFCDSAGIGLHVVASILLKGEMVSSSRIRALVALGEMSQVTQMLSRPHRVRGQVARGAARGATIGFPTANLEEIPNLVPAPGVYAGQAYSQQETWPAAIHIGPNPTFAEEQVKFEVHLIGFEGDLYGEWLEVDIVERLRGTQTFDSSEALQKQLRKDVQQAARIQTK